MYEVPDWPTKYTHSQRQEGVVIWSVVILEHGSLKGVCVEAAITASVVSG